jgi:hypothetical protein
MGLYILSWLVVWSLVEDVLLGGYPNALPVRALKQST